MRAKKRVYRLSPLAEADLERIWVYSLDNWSVQQADRYHGDIVAVLVDLAAGRRTGRPVSVREGYLKYPVGSHFVFYRLTDRSVDVIRILHKRMDVERHF
jgi:toxin ParE1/3/4